MAERLKFRFTRIAKIGEYGVLSIDVNDPKNVEEIKEKLSSRTFATFYLQGREYTEEEWNFKPVNDDDE